MDDPNADTEWNDILRAKGILPPKPKELELTEKEMIDMIEQVNLLLSYRVGLSRSDSLIDT